MTTPPGVVAGARPGVTTNGPAHQVRSLLRAEPAARTNPKPCRPPSSCPTAPHTCSLVCTLKPPPNLHSRPTSSSCPAPSSGSCHPQDRIDYICGKEGVNLEPEAFQLLATISGGDLRKAVTTLQSAVRLSGGHVDRWVNGGKEGGRGKQGGRVGRLERGMPSSGAHGWGEAMGSMTHASATGQQLMCTMGGQGGAWRLGHMASCRCVHWI